MPPPGRRPSQRIAVVGGVASGPAAAAAAKRADADAEVVLFEQGEYMSYGACEMPYYLGDQIEDAERLLVVKPEVFEQTRHVTVHLQHRVESIAPKTSRLTVTDLQTGQTRTERFDKFILATGSAAIRPDFVHAHDPNVFVLRTLRHAIDLKAFLDTHPVDHAVIVGGSYVGLEVAEALRRLDKRVTVLAPHGPLATMTEAAQQQALERVVADHQVQLRRERATALLRTAEGVVRAVRTDQHEVIGCDLVVVAVGVRPRTELAQAAGLKIGVTGGIAVDSQMRTNLPNVWACGDGAELRRVIDDGPVNVSLAAVSYRTAKVAGKNAARRGRGTPRTFGGVSLASAVRVFGFEVAALGLRLGEARAAGYDAFATDIQHLSRVKIYPGAKPIWLRLVAERAKGRILGASIAGEEGAALRLNALVPLVRGQGTVYDLADQDFIYTPPLSPMHDPLTVAARRAVRALSSN
ncbi:MAG: FAD-dependent oxidoreductase [Bacteroidota bacterium]